MVFTRPAVLLLSLIFLNSTLATGTQTAVAVPQPSALLQQSLATMAATLPLDSTATGNVTIIAGSLTSQGTVQVLTRGGNQTSISFETTNGNWSVTYSGGRASATNQNGTTIMPVELATSSQSPYFPLAFLAGFLSNPDISFQYVGIDQLGSSPANHIRAQNTFQSNAALQFLADFTTTDIWLDAASGLPVKISFVRRYGGGSAPNVPISVSFSNYQTVSGVRYPFTIQESVNGALWATTTIESVAFNTGLTDANFPVAVGSN